MAWLAQFVVTLVVCTLFAAWGLMLGVGVLHDAWWHSVPLMGIDQAMGVTLCLWFPFFAARLFRASMDEEF